MGLMHKEWGVSEAKLIREILHWARFHPSFDSDFVHSVDDYLERRGEITAAQENALINIYNEYRVGDWLELNPTPLPPPIDEC